MLKFIIRLIIICISIFFCDEIISQTTFDLIPAPSKNRISENASRCLIQDRFGFIWIGTIDGLNRYDGYDYKTYQKDPSDSTSISDDFIQELLEDSRGNIWVATFGGINRYSRACDCFIRYKGEEHNSKFFERVMTDILEDHNHRLWVSSYSGMGYWDEKRDTFLHFFNDNYGGRIREINVTALYEANDGSLWIGYKNKGLTRYKDGRFTHYSMDEQRGNLPDIEVSHIQQYKDGKLWVSTKGGLFLFDPGTGVFEKKINGWCLEIKVTKPGKFLANVSFDGIYEWIESEGKFKKNLIFYNGKPVDGDIKVFIEDNDGTVWCTWEGLAKQDPFEKRFKHFIHENVPGHWKGKVISSINGDENGNLAILTQSDGINYWNNSKKEWGHFADCLNLKFGGNQKNICLPPIQLVDGQIMLPLYDKFAIIDVDTRALKIVSNEYLQKSPINDLFKTPDGDIWVVNEQEVLLLKSGYQQTWKRFGIKDGHPKLIHRDRDGQIWVASNKGIFKYEVENDSFLAFYEEKSEVLFSQSINCIQTDLEGDFWIGRKFGLIRIDRKTGQSKLFTTVNGLPSNNINAILVDNKGELWLSSNNGISRFDRVSETFQNFDKKDGLQDEIFLPRSSFQGPNGIFYFGGINGYNYFHPDSLKIKNPNTPNVVITDFKIFNRSVRPGKNSILDTSISDSKSVILKSNQTSISFELVALGYTQPEKNQYAYMIEGVDPDWNLVGTNRTAFFSGLPTGKWLTFKAKAANHDGVWSNEVTSLRLYIKPPFWKTIVFKISLITFLILLLIVAYRLRIKNIKSRNKWLEKEVDRKTKKIAIQASSLLSANEELKLQAETIRRQIDQLNQLNESQSRFFTSLSHEFRTPLTLILGHLDEIKYSKDPLAILNRVTDQMNMNIDQLLGLVNQLMDTAKLENGQYKLQVQEGSVVYEVAPILDSFQVLASNKGLHLFYNISEQVPEYCWFDISIIQKVINNLVSNAIKFTRVGKIWVNIDYLMHSEGELKIEVEDSGIGMSKEQIAHIFDRFYRVVNPVSDQIQGTGIGLSLVKQLVDIHKGKIEVSSILGQGSKFAITIPTHRSAFSKHEIVERKPTASWRNSQTKFYSAENQQEENGLNLPDLPPSTPIILVVEDNFKIRAFVVRQLKGKFRVIEASNGKEGWEKAVSKMPELIISDIMMPEMNGFELCEKVKNDQRTSHIPVLLLTALSQQEKRITGLQTGADAYLTKPFSKFELLLMVTNFLKHQHKMRQKFFREYRPDNIPEGVNALDEAFLKKINEWTEDRINIEKVDLKELTRHLGVSRTQLFRKLKAMTGMSITEFIRDYKLRKAYQLLEEQKLTITQIIYATGFNSRSYFYDSFRKKFGVSPSDIRTIKSD